MVVAETSQTSLQPGPGGVWWVRGWGSARIAAGITDRRADPTALLAQLPPATRIVQAEQVHGASVAVLHHAPPSAEMLAGCDALLTDVPGLALAIRTADCLPVCLADPARGVVGIAHVGWRGLAASLPGRLVAAVRHAYQCPPEALQVVIGPGIRACCYEVGPELLGPFGSFVQSRGTLRMCDLAGAAIEQLRHSGLRAERILDTQQCTACEPERWFSPRREGPETGRLMSFVPLRG